MIDFTRLDKDVNIIAPYIKQSTISFCDISLGVRFMWRDDFVIDYAIKNQTLIMKETCPDYENAFYYPIGADVEGALKEIENWTRKNNIPLKFCCIDNFTASELVKRYDSVSIINDRDWSDYIYTAEQFKTYSGKKLSGQRNHVNKFKKLYPDYRFKKIEKADLNSIKNFLSEFDSRKQFMRWSEAVEQRKVFDLVEKMSELNQVGGMLIVGDKVVGFSVGEIVGDTMIVHVEKALTDYDGVYPTLAKEFANAFCTENVKYINREEDCGDTGLRISKIQYQPLEIKEKNIVSVYTLFEKLSNPIMLCAKDLTISSIEEKDKDRYRELYLDDQLNKWWGYDYREDLKDSAPTSDYFFNFQLSLKKIKEEYSFAVRLDGEMIGELVLHNFDYFGGVEMGFRFFESAQGKGYATISATALKEYVFNVMGARKLKSRCNKLNKPSRALIERLGLKRVSEDNTHYYFEMKNDN